MQTLNENYHNIVNAFTPENSPVRSFYTFGIEYFNKVREVYAGLTNVETPEAWMENMFTSLKKTTELNLEYSNKYMELYREYLKTVVPVNVN
ncbi:MAG: hypothetical protein OHK0039_42950 [Bacteroidia bacterium]